MKAGVALQSAKEATTLIASNTKLGSNLAILGKTAENALKGIDNGASWLLPSCSFEGKIRALVVITHSKYALPF